MNGEGEGPKRCFKAQWGCCVKNEEGIWKHGSEGKCLPRTRENPRSDPQNPSKDMYL